MAHATQLVKAAFDKIVQETIDATANQDSDRIDRFCRRFVTAVHYLGKQLCKDYDTGEQEKFRQQCEQVHRVLLSFADSKWQEFRDSLNRLDVRKALNSSIELRNLAELFSSSLAMHLEDLKTMGIKNEIRMPDGDRSKLDQERDRVRDLAREKTAKQLEAATEVDNLTHKYFDAVLAGCSSATASLKGLYEFIKKPTPGQSRRQHARLVCLSDATGSMSSLWNNAQSTINVMIRRIKEIGGNNFELLWVAYRDYSERDNMLELSGWTSDAQQLQNFVNGIRCHGGGDCEEAVEQALLLARNEHRRKGISRVILIGDAPPHFEKKGQQLSNHRGVVLETDYQTEAQELKSLEVGNHSGTKETFQLIANETGGQFADLSPESLIHAVCTSVLMDIGGEELVMEYRERFQ